ncbi:SDR family oxidoreductase [Mycolicibacterium vinylchloridicum]|uniref:SDR family oxidoreductase n=1 Tax=Mycolicibacterium vinylchloridicum TaxID=2736928 RepID=UPI0015CC7D60|nr:SDR family oxidoreductase [Mycolicibacterium vinylchloridicum]
MKSIFITGAGSGIGRAGAELFLRNGWRVGAVDRDADGLATLSGASARLWTDEVDVTDKAALAAALATFCEGNPGGRLDMMWNNAGIGQSGWFEDVPYDLAMKVVDINFRAVLAGAVEALPYLKKTPNSLMFTTSSSAATYGLPMSAVYSATKHAVKGLTEALSVEWSRHGIRVADVLPGFIDTGILVNTPNHSKGGATLTHKELEDELPKRGMMRIIPPSEVADAAWSAYHHPKRLHWYVPQGIRWIDRLKGISPEFVRGRIRKAIMSYDVAGSK